MAEVQKTADQAEKTNIQKTGEAAKEGGVIAGQKNQEVHGQAFTSAHQNDKTLSEPDMIAMNDGETVAEYKARVAQIQANRFGFFDSTKEESKVYEKRARQAVEPPPPVKKDDPEFQSAVKLNVQITNVPEVSEGVKPDELLQYADTALQSGAQTVRPIKDYLAKPNAVTDSLLQIGPAMDNAVNYYVNTPGEQMAGDVQEVIDSSGDAIEGSLGHAMTPEERAKAAGSVMPVFFFEGNAKKPINPQTVEQMGLEGMTEAELKALGIEKRVEELGAVEAESIGEAKGVKSSEIVNQEAFEMDIQPKPASLSNIEARDWYNAQVAKIDAAEQTMRQAGKTQEEIFEVTTEMRNQAKQLARDFMKDRRAAARLDKESPIKPKEEYLEKYGGDYEKAIEASKRTNAQVNKRIEELRKERDKDS